MEPTNQVSNLLNQFQQTNASQWVAKLEVLVWTYGLQILGALVILVGGLWIARFLRGVLGKVLARRQLDPIIAAFIRNLAHIAMLAFVVIAALQTAGIPTTSFIAVIGAAGLAIGLALQSSLSNFAAGFLLIIFRPFKKGDYIEAGGTGGLVEEIQVFTTVLLSPDNKQVIVPNAKIMGDSITNFSANDARRVDWTFGVSYRDDIDKVKATVRRVLEADPRIDSSPAPLILLSSLGDNSVNFSVRAWAKSADYWDVFFAINEQIKKAFDAAGISFPYPQRDVHLYTEK